MKAQNQIVLIEDSESSFRVINAALRNDFHLQWIQKIDHLSINSLLNSTPNLFIMDIGLPEREMGFSLLKILNQSFPEIPKIIITCYSDATTAVRAFKLGAIDYIQKPFDTMDFKERIHEALQCCNHYSENSSQYTCSQHQ